MQQRSSPRSSGVSLDLVGSHGQTVAHEHGVATLQIGEAAVLAERLGCPVVADFRQNDIAVGGCGAPLVPMVDRWLLSRPGVGILTLNLGGIANVTACRPPGMPRPVFGFDCGPGGMVLDELARRRSAGKESCDRDGRLAAAGLVDPALLTELLADPALARHRRGRSAASNTGRHSSNALAGPAATGRRPPVAGHVRHVHRADGPGGGQGLPDIRGAGFKTVGEVIVSGGGARNLELMRRLALAFDPVPVAVTSDRYGLPVDFKEAIAFALLASARVDGIPANLPAVTGARRPVLLGKLTEC